MSFSRLLNVDNSSDNHKGAVQQVCAAFDHWQLSQTGTCVRGGGVYAAPVRTAHTQSKRFLKVASILAREEVAAPCTIADSVE